MKLSSVTLQHRHATFLIIHSEPLEGHHAHWKLGIEEKKLTDVDAHVVFLSVRVGGVTWEVVRLASHGLCLQAELREEERSLCTGKPAAVFHVAPQQVETVNRINVARNNQQNKQPIMEIPAINLKVRLLLSSL